MKCIQEKFLSVILVMFFLFSYNSFSQNSWKIEKNKEGIKVYTKFKKGSGLKSFKAVTTVVSTVEEIIRILKNANEYSKWYGYTKRSKLLKKEKDVQYNYVETKFPWPYKNRDMVYKMSLDTISSKEIKISLRGIPSYIPDKEGVIRMKKAEGYILLKSSGSTTKVIYEFHSEPGESIPLWLANKSIANLPFETLSGLREMLK